MSFDYEQQLAALNKKREEEERNLELCAKANTLAASILTEYFYRKIERIHPHCYGGDATICLTLDDFKEAEYFMSRLSLVQLYRKKEGGFCLLPEREIERKGIADHKRTTPCTVDYYVKVRGELYADKCTYTVIAFVTVAPDFIIKFEVDVQDRAYNVQGCKREIKGGIRVESQHLNKPQGCPFNQSVKMWSSEGNYGDYYVWRE